MATLPHFIAESPPVRDQLGPWSQGAELAYCRSLDGMILEANVAFARKLGRPPTDLQNRPLVELVHVDDAGQLQATLDEIARPPHRTTAYHRWLTPQGVRWLAWEEVAVQDTTGAITSVRATGRDITLQRLAEEQFYRLSRAVEQSPVAIVITHLDGRAQYVNEKFTEVTGRTLEDLLDGNVDVLRDGHPDTASYEAFWSTIRAGGEWRGELATTRGAAGTVWESVKVSCLRGSSGEITNYLCLREDITERKRLEGRLRQAQKMESLGTLAGGIAHDFNNLLAVILGYAELCQQRRSEPAVIDKGLREVHRAADRARGLVRQILTFSRKTEVRFSSVDLNQVARELVMLLTETFPRTVVFQLDLQENLPPLLADASQVQQIVLNLCVNARDAMPAGGTITLSTRARGGATLPGGAMADLQRDYACVTISDTGIGMPPEVRQRLFEPFFTTKPPGQGTGLGLAVVYGIVIAHHGFIDVESTPGAGSTFNVFLPLNGAASPVALAAGPTEFPRGTESLLVVDDEKALRTLLSTALSGRGYRVATAATGLEAIELLRDGSRRFDAALLDLNMPGASGIQVLKTIRSSCPLLKVMVISGLAGADTRASLKQLGNPLFIQKPYSLDEMGRKLRHLLDTPISDG